MGKKKATAKPPSDRQAYKKQHNAGLFSLAVERRLEKPLRDATERSGLSRKDFCTALMEAALEEGLPIKHRFGRTEVEIDWANNN